MNATLTHIDHDLNMHRFWNIVQRGRRVTVQWGRIDNTGMEQTYTYDSTADAVAFTAIIIASKLRKGYK